MVWVYCEECKHFKHGGICEKTGIWVNETVRVSDCPEFEKKED